MSTPSVVEDENAGEKGLVLACPHPGAEVGREEEDGSGILAIREVSFQSIVGSEWKDTNYVLNADPLAWAFVTPAGPAGQQGGQHPEGEPVELTRPSGARNAALFPRSWKVLSRARRANKTGC